MPKILVCQHVAHELLGTLHPLLKEEGFRIRYVNFSRNPEEKPQIEDYDGLILLGGPMNVNQEKEYPFLNHELHLIETALKKELPTLGICLGSQLIAKTLGAEVRANIQSEIGWKTIKVTEAGKKDALLSSFQKEEKLFEWHHDSFQLPSGAKGLAESESCREQAFRYGKKTYGFQFHLEVDEAMIEKWLKDPAHQIYLNQTDKHPSVETIRQQTQLYIESLKSLSYKTFSEFIKLFDFSKKKQRLSSR